MSKSQPEALRLAAAWGHTGGYTDFHTIMQRGDEMVAELRRLHALNAELVEALKLAISSHGVYLPTDPPQEAWKSRRVDDVARAVIAKAEGEKP